MKFPTLLEVISTKLGKDRAPISRGLFKRLKADSSAEPNVDREGGKFGAGLIRGVSILTRGEALGHGMWIDETTLDQTVELAQGNPKTGLKMRFTHPSMSGDGLGSFIGRGFDLYREGDQVFADVHLSETSRKTPDGDLGAYVMDLAESDPEAFGTSIVFEHDEAAEDLFMAENQVEYEFVNWRGDTEVGTRFESPDAENGNNFPHVRLKNLFAADFVDEPAANPDGLFHRGPTHDVLKQADGVLEYVLGLTDQAPKETGGLSAERLRGYLNRFLDGRSMELSVSRKENEMKKETKLSEGAETVDAPETGKAPETAQEATEATSEAPKPVETAEEPETKPEGFSKAEAQRFTEKFGAEKAMGFLMAGTSFEDALSQEFDALKAKASIVGGESRGEKEPVGTFGAGGKGDRKTRPADAWARDIIRFNGRAPAPSQN